MFLLLLIQMVSTHAVEVIRPEFGGKIELKIVRAEPDSFETYTLMNHNGREMTLVCANNRVYDHNPKAFIEYRNFYNVIAGNFEISSDRVCKEMGRFIEAAQYGISEEKPFIITLDKKNLKVEKIVYPKIDQFDDQGNVDDLLPKAPIEVNPAKIKPLG